MTRTPLWHNAAELVARASHYEAAADALAQKQELDARCIATAVEQRCERLFVTIRAELATSQAALRSWSKELRSERRSFSETLQSERRSFSRGRGQQKHGTSLSNNRSKR